ncbi:Ig-like domain-containing protein [Aestuariibius sp. HNIBRBA575]|uniref:Ig-like domain-containing protein n=1 Tax=Aestuariibius sp. HNIBRBA575 TaxID=3233343 RepID=UPI0034A13F78
MSAINFVVRTSAGTIQRGVVAGDGAPDSIVVGADADVSLNLHASQVTSYSRQGQALEVTLIDGRVVTVEGFFATDGIAENRLFLSSGGALAEVDLVADGTGMYYAQYSEAEIAGKWGADESLYFMREPDVMLADAYVGGDPEVGMLATPLMALGGFGGAGAAAAAAGVGAVIIGGGGGGGGSNPSAPVVAITHGTESVGHVVNDEDHSDGVEIGGTGDAGATVVVTIGDATQEVIVGEDGTWDVVFDSTQVIGGEYETPVSVTITNDNGSSTITDVLVVDTIAGLEFDASTVEIDGTVNAVENSDGVTLNGTVEAGSTVSVLIDGQTYDAVVEGSSWSLALGAGVIAGGEYDLDVTVTSTDAHGNMNSITDTLVIDTETSVTVSSATIGGDGMVNGVEHAAGMEVTGTAQAGATVVVTFGDATHTVTAGADGSWSSTFTAAEVAAGTYEATVTAVATDAAGNSATASGTVQIDTEATVTLNTSGIEGDGVVNMVEASDGVTLTGTAQAGSAVSVVMNGFTHTTTAGADGSWSVDFASYELPSGELDAGVDVTATDSFGNVAMTSGTVTFDTLVDPLTHGSDPTNGDGYINAAEVGQPITLTGTVEAGSTVMVTMGGSTQAASVDANGNWTVNFAANTLAEGEYQSDIVISATDAAGNTSTLTETVNVDTVAGDVALSSQPIEIDDVVNGVEAADGVIISGTATPGLIVTVTLGGVSHQVMAGANGAWSTTYSASEVPTGTYDAAITASITDAAGNFKEVADTVHIDTQVDNFTMNGPIEGDDIISGAEATDGVTVSGTVEPHSVVVVELGGATQTVLATASGTWTANFAASDIPAGESVQTVTATATDRAGNVETITDSVEVDTIVNTLSATDPVEGDNIVNFVEASDGLTLTGMVEVGSSVNVTFEGVTRAATVDGAGNWSVDFTAAEVPAGDYTANVTIDATDAVGNTASITDTFRVDTTVPETPMIDSINESGSGIGGVFVDDNGETLSVSELDNAGNVSDLSSSQFDLGDRIFFDFNTDTPDGSHLIVSAEDTSGNSSSTLFVANESGTNAVDLSGSGLNDVNLDAIDLQVADDSELVLTADMLNNLSDNGNALTVHGGSDDTVTMSGALATGQSATIDGSTYDIYSLGDEGGTVIIDDDINVII